jgi:hypothetical protein
MESFGDRWTLDPWPFTPSELTVRCEGRLLTAPHTARSELERALADAPQVTLSFTLMPDV